MLNGSLYLENKGFVYERIRQGCAFCLFCNSDTYFLQSLVGPIAFLRSAKYFRKQLNRLSFGIFMPDHVIKMIDENPRFQIWFVRIGYPFILTFIACVFFVSAVK